MAERPSKRPPETGCTDRGAGKSGRRFWSEQRRGDDENNRACDLGLAALHRLRILVAGRS